MSEYTSKGQGALNTVLGAIGTAGATGILNGNMGGLFGCNSGCGDNAYVNRYEAQKDAEIARLRSQIELRDANTYTMTEMGKLRDYVDRKFDCINASISSQAVVNNQVAANLSCVQGNIATLMALTKTVVPIDNVCPAPMPQYNSWTAPT